MKGCGTLRRALILLIVILLVINNVYANLDNDYKPSPPAFEILLMDKSPLEVKHEKLIFDIDPSNNNDINTIDTKANLNAEYIIFNPKSETVKACISLPFITNLYNIDIKNTIIQYDNEPLPYDIRLGNQIDLRLNKNNEINMKSVKADMYKKPYEALFIDDEKDSYLYNIDVECQDNSYIEVSFYINKEKSNIILYGFDSFSSEQKGGKCKCTLYCDNYKSVDYNKLSFLVIGEKISNLKVSTFKSSEKEDEIILSNSYNESRIKLKDFIIESIINPSYINELFSVNEVYDIVLKILDNNMKDNNFVIDNNEIDTILRSKNYIAFYLYEIIVHPHERSIMNINYNISPTLDKCESVCNKNIYKYILNPENSFKKFGKIDIKISPENDKPYIIDSNIKLERLTNGDYIASIDYLSKNSIEFSTYNKPSISFIEKLQAKYLRDITFLQRLVIILVVVVVLLIIIFKIFKYYIKKKHNLL